MCLSVNLTRISHVYWGGAEMETRMRFFPWLQSRAAKQHEKRDALEVIGGGGLSNLSAIWSFLDGGFRSNESDEVVNDSTALSVNTVWVCCRLLGDAVAQLPCRIPGQTAHRFSPVTQCDLTAPQLIWAGSPKSALLACSHGRSESHQTFVCSATT
jgi:hypothetical protein